MPGKIVRNFRGVFLVRFCPKTRSPIFSIFPSSFYHLMTSISLAVPENIKITNGGKKNEIESKLWLYL